MREAEPSPGEQSEEGGLSPMGLSDRPHEIPFCDLWFRLECIPQGTTPGATHPADGLFGEGVGRFSN